MFPYLPCIQRVHNTNHIQFSYFGEFVIRGQLGCYNDVHLVADSPAMDSIKDGDLSDWSCSVHEAFSSYPTTGLNSFQALAIAENVLGDGSRTFADNTTGLPYIISRGATPTHCGDNNFDKEFGEQCDDGNKEDGDGCNRSCQCEAGYKEDGKGKCFLENACPAPPDWWLSSVSAAAASATANLTTLTTTTTSDISTSTLSPSELPAELPADTPYGY
jgi:cysteine-rich repeat protein